MVLRIVLVLGGIAYLMYYKEMSPRGRLIGLAFLFILFVTWIALLFTRSKTESWEVVISNIDGVPVESEDEERLKKKKRDRRDEEERRQNESADHVLHILYS